MKLIFVFLFLAQCGDAPITQTGKNPQQQPSIESQFSGKWSGILRYKENGNVLQETSQVAFSFFDDLAFEMTVSSDLAKGNYKILPEQKLAVFSVKESNMTRFATASSIQTLSFELSGNNLTLSSQSSDFRLDRVESKDNYKTNQKTLHTTWLCQESSQILWQVKINPNFGFEGLITSQGARKLWFNGKCKNENGSRGVCTIANSNDAQVLGISFRYLYTQNPQEQMQIGKVPRDDTSEIAVQEWIKCAKEKT